jgi:type VI secretion system protein ImpF
MSATANGYHLPLFDRLAASGEAWLQGDDALRQSVEQELSRLLNTRSHLTFEAFGLSDGTVVDYGVPDFSERSLRSDTDRDAIAAAIRHAITLFEPRLSGATVTFKFPAGSDKNPVLVIGGRLNASTSAQHVFFEMASGGQGAADPRWAEQG